MTKIAGTLNTYGTVGIKENVSDAIYNISPKTTPFMSNAAKDEASQSLFEWQIDSLAAPDGNNAQLEGDNITSVSVSSTTTRVSNYCQISRKTAGTSGTNEASEKYGRGSELEYQMAKRSAELKRDVETILLQNQAAAAGADDVTARKTGSILAWIKTNTDKGAGAGADPVYTTLPNATRTDGTLRTWTEVILKSIMLKAYNSGAEPDTIMLGPALKQATSVFTGIAVNRVNLDPKQHAFIVGAADFYASDFGTLAIVPDRFMRSRDALFLDFNFVAVAYLRPFFTKTLPESGDAKQQLLLGEYGLKVKNEAALALATDLQP